jgi:hypothetical protein
MKDFILEYWTQILWTGGVIIGGSIAYARLLAKVEYLEKDMVSTKSFQNKEIDGMKVDLKDLTDCVDEHHTNTRVHIDPERDERRWQEMRNLIVDVGRRVESIDDRLRKDPPTHPRR